MLYSDADWRPTKILGVGAAEKTSTGVTRVLTDAGWAFCKPLGNRQGPHALACEWACMRLARWMGLRTFRAAVIDLASEVVFPLPKHKEHRYTAEPGPCFLTQATSGRQWNRSEADLELLVNRDDIAKLVAFDTWVLNRDRHHPDYAIRKPNFGNVFFADAGEPRGRFRLVAMDHTHCFDNGQLHARLGEIRFVKDELVYGLFPQFQVAISPITLAVAVEPLGRVSREIIEPILAEVPSRWQVDDRVRTAWRDLCVARAHYLAESLVAVIQAKLNSDETGST